MRIESFKNNKEVIIGIYKITNLINNKCYIGESLNIYRRWREHIRKAFNKNSPYYNRPLYAAFRNYGLENFNFEILESCDEKIRFEREQYWTDCFNCIWPEGYSLLSSSYYDSLLHIDKATLTNFVIDLKTTELSLTQLSKKYSININFANDINCGRIKKFRLDSESYPIISKDELARRRSLNSEGLTKAKFASICKEIPQLLKTKTLTEVAKELKTSVTSIRRWCKFYGINITMQDRFKVGYQNHIKQYTLNGDFIAEYTSANIAAKALFKSTNFAGHILKACNGKFKAAGGFQWCFTGEEHKIKTNIICGNARPVQCMETGIIYKSIAEAEKQVGYKISNCLCGYQKTAGGQHWIYL